MRTRSWGRCPASAGSGWRPACRSTASAAAAGSDGRWPAGSRRATRAWTSGRTARGGSATRIGTRGSRRDSRGRPTADYYRLRYPFDADEAGRPRRLSPLHGRLQEAGAVFGTKAGWERADHHEPGRPWRRAGRDQAAYGWTRPPWFDRVADGGAGGPRAGRTHRPELVRQDRRSTGPGPSACSSTSPPTTSTSRSGPSSTRRGATTAAGWSRTSRPPDSRTTGSGS